MTEHEVSSVLEGYDRGRVTRREVVARLALLLEVQLAAPGHRA